MLLTVNNNLKPAHTFKCREYMYILKFLKRLERGYVCIINTIKPYTGF